MTINIGSNKIGRLAIGQSDGTIKEIKQLNLGTNVIYRNAFKYKLPQKILNTGFYFHFPYLTDEIRRANLINNLEIHNPYSNDLVVKVYDNNNFSEPVFQKTMLASSISGITRTSIPISRLNSTCCLEIAAQNLALECYESVSDPNITAFLSIGKNQTHQVINGLGIAHLTKMPNMKYFTEYGADIILNQYQFYRFNHNGCIKSINNDTFIFNKSTSVLKTHCFKEFNTKGELEYVNLNGFNLTKIRQISDSSPFRDFNGTTSSNCGKLTSKSSLSLPLPVNTNLINATGGERTNWSYNNNSPTQFSTPNADSYEWYANDINIMQ